MQELITFKVGRLIRSINIIAEIPEKAKKEMIRLIKYYCYTLPAGQAIKWLNVTLVDGPLDVTGDLDFSGTAEYFEDTDAGRIFINVLDHLPLDKKRFGRTIKHEFRHLYDRRENIYLRKFFERLKFYNKHMYNVVKKFTNTINKEALERKDQYLWASLYRSVSYFLVALMEEGLASYCQKRYYFNDQTFERLHEEAYAELNKFLQYLQSTHTINKSGETLFRYKIEEVDIEFKRLYSGSYKIGLHIVYTILYYTKYTIKNFEEWSPITFLKVYEKACVLAKIRPIIGMYNESNAIFSYTAFIKNIFNTLTIRVPLKTKCFHCGSESTIHPPLACGSCGKKIEERYAGL